MDLFITTITERASCNVKLPQAILTSATLSPDVERLKKLVLHNPVTLRLSEPDLPDPSQLTQYVIKLEEVDKVILVYALFKLELIKGKTLMFVSSVDRCYKMKLYLEQVGQSRINELLYE